MSLLIVWRSLTWTGVSRRSVSAAVFTPKLRRQRSSCLPHHLLVCLSVSVTFFHFSRNYDAIICVYLLSY